MRLSESKESCFISCLSSVARVTFRDDEQPSISIFARFRVQSYIFILKNATIIRFFYQILTFLSKIDLST